MASVAVPASYCVIPLVWECVGSDRVESGSTGRWARLVSDQKCKYLLASTKNKILSLESAIP